jgi:hypothetical protein
VAVTTSYKPVAVQKEQSQATVTPPKPSAGAAVTASCKPVGVQKVQTQATLLQQKPTVGAAVIPVGVPTAPQVNRASTTAPQPNKTISTSSVISTGKLVSAKLEIPPSLMPLKNLVPLPQNEVGTCAGKSLLDRPPEKESSTTVSPLVRAAAESNPKGKSPDVATVAGTGQKSS